MNSEKLVIIKISDSQYKTIGKIFNFTGSLEECKDYAKLHRFGGGVLIYKNK